MINNIIIIIVIIVVVASSVCTDCGILRQQVVSLSSIRYYFWFFKAISFNEMFDLKFVWFLFVSLCPVCLFVLLLFVTFCEFCSSSYWSHTCLNSSFINRN